MTILSPIFTKIESLNGPLPTELTAATLMLYTVPNTSSFTYIFFIRILYSMNLPLSCEQLTSFHTTLLVTGLTWSDVGKPTGTIQGKWVIK